VRYDLSRKGGLLNIVDMRTILYNYLFAKAASDSSSFYLKIDDTSGSVEQVQENLKLLKALGITWTGEEMMSKRLAQYKKFARSLIEVRIHEIMFDHLEPRCLLLLLL
jgi:glutamyl/glutaminyl-tRNA synthetase